ncbi:heme exporter protein CcmD [Bosea sp. AAP35]|uniref:heme exporter protein CcmD n=1 Tax=Bosea sp. AAP35 TaxID=1523417 RepID=UPI0009EA0DAF|nr:heme exporter protein CcmD [Bosea sp. AAP35]
MSELGPHASFILASYAAVAVVLGGLIASVLLDHRAQTRALAELEQRGVGRRSDRGRS